MRNSKKEIQEFIKRNRPKWRKLGLQYRQRRESLGLSLSSFARRLSVGYSTLQKFENGDPMYSRDRIETMYGLLLEIAELKQRMVDMPNQPVIIRVSPGQTVQIDKVS